MNFERKIRTRFIWIHGQNSGTSEWSQLYDWLERLWRCWISTQWTIPRFQPTFHLIVILVNCSAAMIRCMHDHHNTACHKKGEFWNLSEDVQPRQACDGRWISWKISLSLSRTLLCDNARHSFGRIRLYPNQKEQFEGIIRIGTVLGGHGHKTFWPLWSWNQDRFYEHGWGSIFVFIVTKRLRFRRWLGGSINENGRIRVSVTKGQWRILPQKSRTETRISRHSNLRELDVQICWRKRFSMLLIAKTPNWKSGHCKCRWISCRKDINKNIFWYFLDSDGNILHLAAIQSPPSKYDPLCRLRTFNQGGKQPSSSSSSSFSRISRVSRIWKEWRDESEGGRRRGRLEEIVSVTASWHYGMANGWPIYGEEGEVRSDGHLVTHANHVLLNNSQMKGTFCGRSKGNFRLSSTIWLGGSHYM